MYATTEQEMYEKKTLETNEKKEQEAYETITEYVREMEQEMYEKRNRKCMRKGIGNV